MGHMPPIECQRGASQALPTYLGSQEKFLEAGQIFLGRALIICICEVISGES